MSIKGIGAILIIAGCSGFGISLASASRREVRLLQSLIEAITHMENELQYSLSPLPDLCRQTGHSVSGAIRDVFLNLARELDWQVSPDVQICMHEALARSPRLPSSVHQRFLQLGSTLGRFDLSGQIKELEAIQLSCQQTLLSLSQNQDSRLRSLQTLGICTGAALAILLV